MKNARFEEYIEVLEAEPGSPNYDSVFSGMLELDSRVRNMSKKYGKKVDEIWDAIDVDPNTFFANYTEDKAVGKNEKEVYKNLKKLHEDALFFYHPAVMKTLDDFEKMLVPAKDMEYGGTSPKYTKTTAFGAAMMVLGVANTKGILGKDGIPTRWHTSE